jgi:O-methyltransferase involved in polyketide biosynthesis
VYLERSVLEAVLRQFHAVAGAGSLLAISLSVTTRSAEGASRRHEFQARVARLGEPVRSGVEVDQVGPLLSSTGWRAQDLTAGEDSIGSRRVRAGFILADRA